MPTPTAEEYARDIYIELVEAGRPEQVIAAGLRRYGNARLEEAAKEWDAKTKTGREWMIADAIRSLKEPVDD